MTTADLYLLVAETHCEHGRLILDDAARTGTSDDWTVYLHDAAQPCTSRVPDYHAFQTHAPALPPAWIVLQIELADPATGDVRTVPSLAAYHQLRQAASATPVA